MQNHLSNGDVISLVSSYMGYANILVVGVVSVATILTAAITIFLTIYHNRDKKELIKKATQDILDKIADNEQMRNDFINKILENKNFKQEFEAMVDIYVSDKMDRLADENQEKSNIGGLK